MTQDRKVLSLALVAALSIIMMVGIVAANPDPFGAEISEGEEGRAESPNAQSNDAIAGNVTGLTVEGESITQSWQGYYGNVTGSITLADGSDNVMYNWSLASPEGEIYAVNNSDNVDWKNIDCFDIGNASKVNSLESSYGIDADDIDGVNETFNENNHEKFYVASQEFTSGQCRNAKIYDDTGTGVFDEVILEDSGGQTIFMSILKEDVTGFDGNSHDFEMLVLEDGHGTDTATTPYFFYVELE